MDSIPDELAAIVKSFEPKMMGPTVEVMSQGEAGEHPGAEVLKAEAEALITWPMVVQPLKRSDHNLVHFFVDIDLNRGLSRRRKRR